MDEGTNLLLELKVYGHDVKLTFPGNTQSLHAACAVGAVGATESPAPKRQAAAVAMATRVPTCVLVITSPCLVRMTRNVEPRCDRVVSSRLPDFGDPVIKGIALVRADKPQ